MPYGSGRRCTFFKYQCLYIGRSDSTTVEHCTDFLCSWNNPACLSDPVMEKTCNGGSDILCACIPKRWDLDGSDGKYPNDRSDFCTVCVGTYLGISIVIHLLDVTEHVRSGSYPVVLKYCGRKQQTQGFVDTGNLLADPVSGTPVSIVSWELMEMLLPEDLTERLACLQEKPEEIKSTEIAGLKPHYLFCRTVGRGERLLLAVTLEELCIQIQGNTVHIKEPVVALSPEPFALGKEYKVLLNSRLLH